MPELPEVETIRRGLEPVVLGRTIEAVDVAHPRAVRKAPAGLAPVVGREIHAVVRRGKYLWFLLDDQALIAHLGMSGQFRVGGENFRHRRASLHLDDGTRLDFVDQRTFGHLQPDGLVETNDDAVGGLGSDSHLIPRSVAHIGRDLLDPALNMRALARRVKAKNSEIKRVLLDQSVASGIGNIYADEALWEARVNGRRPASRMSLAKIAELYDAARAIMARATEVGGTSFDELYVNVNGESGYFDRSLNAYGRAGEPCYRCGTTLVKNTFMNRSSHYCPKCQARTG